MRPASRQYPLIGLATALALGLAPQKAEGGMAQRAPAEGPNAERRTPNAERRAPNAQRPLSLEVLPASITLDGPHSEQAFLVTGRYADGTDRDLTDGAKWSLGKAGVAALDAEGFRLRPLKDGETVLTAAISGKRVRVPVRVAGMAAARPVSFVNDVMPVLTRAGCNIAACHGAQSGKGGFKLSLFGYDPAADYAAIAGDEKNPRISRPAPDQSLLLRKASLAVSHGGGKRILPGTLNYRVLRDWIAGGAPQPGAAAQLLRLEVSPAARVFPETGRAQRLLVRAVYSGGQERDVTSLARYDAQEPEAVEVTDGGVVTPVRKGAGAVMVRYAGAVGTFRAEVPFSRSARLQYPPPANLIDEKVFARLSRLGIPLSGPADDLEFLRRASLDLTGTLPTPDEVREFSGFRVQGSAGTGTASSGGSGSSPLNPEPRTLSPGRQGLVDRLLATNNHVYFWTQKWSDLFKVNSRDLGEPGMLAYYRYFAESVQGNKPWDRVARELLLAQPNSGPEGSYYQTARTAEDRAMSTAEVFLGVRVQCAQCHQHPFESWSQDDFWQFAAFFAKVPGPVVRPANIRGRLALVQPPAPPAEVVNPRTKQPAFPPKPLGAAAVSNPDASGDRRQHLAAWMTAPENPWFARSFVNRVWRHFFGRGIVDPVDDIRVTNPPSDPELLDALAKEFVRTGYDVRALLRLIVNSRTYQTTSRPVPGNAEDTRFFSHAYFRRLTAEQLADAISQATGIPDEYPPYEAGIRAIQLPDPQIVAPFLDTFGRPGRTQACECERTADPSVAQALRLITGPGLSNKATAGNGRIAKLRFYTDKTPDQIWEELYYWSLSRPPRPAERQAWKGHVEERLKANPSNHTGATQEALEDWFWALLNSKEFLFNH